MDEGAITALVSQFPRVANAKGLGYSYGTAGFRGLATTLESVCVRMGMFVALRARACPDEESKLNESQACGIVLTASHNPEPDNGLKMVDPSGGMLAQAWEPVADQLANCEEAEVAALLAQIAEEKRISWDVVPVVFVGRDTRPSSPGLMDLLKQGLAALGARVVDYGQVCTPQIHYCVLQKNSGLAYALDDYYTNLASAFHTLYGAAADSKEAPLVVDCANGVGGISMAAFTPLLKDSASFQVINTDEANLNHLVGAEHVQKIKTLPKGLEAENADRCCSLDGDADRLVYFYHDESKLCLIDGDKITSLMTGYVAQLLRSAEVSDLTLGIVQTAYANGASTHYIEQQLKVPVVFAKTGVKHLHHRALEYDIAVYFEANGHGTAIFSDKAKARLRESDSPAATTLLGLTDLINPAVGDAISDMLACEVILKANGWSLRDWNALYSDYPSLMLKCEVKDRSAIVTTNSERTVVEPAALQEAIDAICGEYTKDKAVRAFVRPSGTEDVVRIYAEASTQERANDISNAIVEAVKQHCN